MTYTPSCDFGQHTQKRQQSCRKAFYSLDSARILSPSLQPDLKAHLWRTAPQAALLYGCEAVPVSRRDIKSMESLQGTLVKQSLRVGKRSHHSNLLSALGVPKVQTIIDDQSVRLLRSVMKNDSPARDLCFWTMSQIFCGHATPPETLVARVRGRGFSHFGRDLPQMSDDTENGVVDTLKAILCKENFLKPYSDELLLLRLLTRF